MTLLSIVVPVYKVQGYLRQCLDSMLSQSFTDFEIVAVDDCSPDNSGAILAEYAARDPRVRMVTAPQNLGLGRARNLGLEHATGEYVWFVDSDDWLSMGSLSAVAARLRSTDADVLLVGWDRVYWDGRVQTGSAKKKLSAAPKVFSVEEWPKVLEILHVAWNKVVRRDFLLRLGFVFEAGWYEDVSFSFPVMLAAPRISTLPRTCVHYRQRRTGAITRTKGDRHFEVFDHWEHALELAARYASPGDEVRGLLFRRMIWHFLAVLRHDARVPGGSRARFFGRMNEMYRKYLPPAGYPMPSGGEGVRYKLVARGSYGTFKLVDTSMKAARRGLRLVRRSAGHVKRRSRQAFGHLYYQLQLRLPVDQSLSLYAAYWFRGVSCNPAAIAAEAAVLAPHLRQLWVVGPAREGALPPGTPHVVAGTLPYYKALARARYLVNNVNWPHRMVKRRGTTHVMTHHGTPLKMMGMDQLDHPAAVTDHDFAGQMRRADRWDFSVTANAHTTIAWDSAYPCDFETLEVGYPRNDRLARATPAESAAMRERLGIAPGRRVVLYMPTHREWLPAGSHVLEVERLAAALGPDTVLLVREHYFHVPAEMSGQTPSSGGRIMDVSGHPVVEDLYLAADVLLTDYSSAMFDFAVLDRPVVVYAPDWQVYRELRGTYFDLLAEPPGAVATDYLALIDLFRSGAYADESSAALRAAFRARFSYLDDGHAAERVVRRVFLDENR
ncbi:bifunctional glycosyltransferase/CDP-glycerol:glycerophosphate glycerophosphotransferase [Paractinoplanes atraurantiacus]|uniref:CDP-glycerol glycerophosphotransferase, TagB/SpsB family n=1 Tax=Paractinoplanes atraurantiacus TaxID=1036182 RepID=A0A285KD71_9ACTN|nr:bifunctional glycosyltransferase family 2 protein/CDP-glycerol:glycerophosphate glycerophosphotransferase [Actinoplanes atraurantiacus]SNY70579.1 CDP-glycerol glycerophosphotransferase, TagB/SpsB family [Actinoplanes atraurantiacus]